MAKDKDKKPGTQLERIRIENQLQSGETSIEENRQRIRRDTTPAFREKLDKCQKWFDREARRSIKARWELGLEIKAVYDDVTDHRGSHYGVHAMEEIGDYFGWDDGVVYASLRLAQQFTEEEIDEICAMKTPGGQPVFYSHLMSIINFEREKRRQLINQAVAESWTAGQLVHVAKEEKEKEERERHRHQDQNNDEKPEKSSKEDGRGRPIGKPKSFDAVAAQMEDFADDFLNRSTLVWDSDEHGLFAKMSQLSTDEYTEEHASTSSRSWTTNCRKWRK